MALVDDLYAMYGDIKVKDLAGTARSSVEPVRAGSTLVTATNLTHPSNVPGRFMSPDWYPNPTWPEYWADRREQDEYIECVYYAYLAPVFDGLEMEDRVAALAMLEDPDPIRFEEMTADEFAAIASPWDDLREIALAMNEEE